MSDETEDQKEQPLNLLEDEARHGPKPDLQGWDDMAERYVDLNKDIFAEEAFVAMFVDILREVSRQQPTSGAGVIELARFFAMLKRGAKVSFPDLCTAALERLRPPASHGDAHDRALLRIATSGLGFLIELGSEDGFAGGRRSQRESALITAIEHFIQDRSARQKAAEERWASQPLAHHNIPSPKEPPRPPPDAATVAEVRQRIRAKITKQRAKAEQKQ